MPYLPRHGAYSGTVRGVFTDPVFRTTLSGGRLDRLHDHRVDEASLSIRRGERGHVHVIWQGQIGVAAGGGLATLSTAVAPASDRWIFLGELDGDCHWALDRSTEDREVVMSALTEHHDGASLVSLREAAATLGNDDANVAAFASGMAQWVASHRHCPACGQELALQVGGHELKCVSCATVQWPRTDPAVIMLVVAGDSALLGRQKIWPPRMYSTLAGFVEPGESLEDAVARETWEEAAIRVGKVRYHCSQPWPFPRSVMIGFHAEYHSGDVTPHATEMDDARWFDRRTLLNSREMGLRGDPMIPPKVTIARALVDAWLDDKVSW
jgi:NAD+ diphosphatase